MIAPLAWFLVGCLAGSTDPAVPAAPPTPSVATGPAAPAPSARRPNVLVIVWDTVRADHTSLYGYAKDTTPLTKAWAEQRGVLYERAVSPGVFTLPSHASLFTGLPVRSHGVNADHTRLDPSLPTFAEALSQGGFDTWAFVANPYLAKGSGLMEGFAEVEAPWDDRWRKAVHEHVASKLDARDGSTALSPAWPKKDKKNKYFVKDVGPVAADALGAWLDRRAAPDRPFFAFVNLMEAHVPRIPTLAARQRTMTPAEIERGWHLVQDTYEFHEWMTGVREYAQADLDAIRGVYDAALIDLDAATAAILALLDERALTGDTIVVLTSDHGESLGEHRLLLHKYGVWNPLSRVPLVISWPGHLQPGREAAPFPVEDTLVRVAELGRLPLGAGLGAVLATRPFPPDGGAITEYDAVAEDVIDRVDRRRHVDRTRLEKTWAALEQGPWKLIVGSDGTTHLFDVLADPGESRDRAPADPATTARLRDELTAWQHGVTPVVRDDARPALADDLREGLESLGYLQ